MNFPEYSTVLNQLSHLLTRWYARISSIYGRVESVEEYSCYGIIRDVFWYDKPDSKSAGHATPFNTILLNRGLLEDHPDEFTDYVFLHEVGHTNVPTILRMLSLPLYVFLILMVLLSPIAAVAMVIEVAVYTGSIESVFLAIIAGSIVVILFCIPFAILSWLDEGYAELVAISHLGIDGYQRCHNEHRPKSESGPLLQAVHRLRYPPPELVIRFARWLKNRT